MPWFGKWYGEGSGPVAGAPVVSNVEPANGLPILPDTPLQFDLTDSVSLLLVAPWIILDPFHLPEPVHDNVDFTPLYQVSPSSIGSSRLAITDGFRYTLRRRGGWTSSPTLLLNVTDSGGGSLLGYGLAWPLTIPQIPTPGVVPSPFSGG